MLVVSKGQFLDFHVQLPFYPPETRDNISAAPAHDAISANSQNISAGDSRILYLLFIIYQILPRLKLPELLPEQLSMLQVNLHLSLYLLRNSYHSLY